MNIQEENLYFEINWRKSLSYSALLDQAIDILRPMNWCWRADRSGSPLLYCADNLQRPFDLSLDRIKAGELSETLYNVGISIYSPSGGSIGFGWQRSGTHENSGGSGPESRLLMNRAMASIPVGLGWTPSLWHQKNRWRTEQVYSGIEALAKGWNVTSFFCIGRSRNSDDDPMSFSHRLFSFGVEGERRIRYLEEGRAPTQAERSAEQECSMANAPWIFEVPSSE